MLHSATFAALLAPSLAQKSDCTDASFGPVTGGIDYVHLQEELTESVDVPEQGDAQYTADLNGYTFWFKSAANVAKFEADPWKYAPAYGGF